MIAFKYVLLLCCLQPSNNLDSPLKHPQPYQWQFDCDRMHQCTGVKSCPTNEPIMRCDFLCDEQLSCMNVVLNCSTARSCLVDCVNYGSCQNITILANYSDFLYARLRTPTGTSYMQSDSGLYTKVYAALRNKIKCLSSKINNSQENDCDNSDIYSKTGSM